MKEKDINARLELDKDIRDWLGFAFELYGKKGIRYTKSEIRRVAKSLIKGELKVK